MCTYNKAIIICKDKFACIKAYKNVIDNIKGALSIIKIRDSFSKKTYIIPLEVAKMLIYNYEYILPFVHTYSGMPITMLKLLYNDP